MRVESPRARLARFGFREPSAAAALLETLDAGSAEVVTAELASFSGAADPDWALEAVVRVLRDGVDLCPLLQDETRAVPLLRLLGGSRGAGEHLERKPEDLDVAIAPSPPRDATAYREALLEAVEADADSDAPVSPLPQQEGVAALRARYRRHLVELIAWDLALEDPAGAIAAVSAALADLASAALEAALAVARRVAQERFGDDAARLRLAVIGMGKLGARELNYLSDVDVIWVHGVSEGTQLDEHRATTIATLLARETTAACGAFLGSPPLWEVDANLRPEGKDGALTRTLDSHVAYYERWAKHWEFQALLKARAVAGDAVLGAAYEERVRAKAFESSSREGFVESVQRMRERVAEHIPADEVDRQLKLGPGGLRDIEFTVQLLQLVHGADDARVRQRGTLDALDALAEFGYIGRAERDEFAEHYRFLRMLEHRIQFWRLRRTHLMPTDDADLRRLARTARLGTVEALLARWQAVRREVRSLHERLFYRPLLGAVAALDTEAVRLTPEHAMRRLEASGYVDAKGALAHIAELTNGISRRAQIQRLLLPVLLGWFAEGADPDMGLLAFRRLSEALGATHWFLGMLRDSPSAARRLARLLSSSKLIGTLMERIPESASWLDDDEQLRPRSREALAEATAAIVARHAGDPKAAAEALRSLRRREMLRIAIGAALLPSGPSEVGRALTDLAEAVVEAAVTVRRAAEAWPDELRFAVLTLGRTGGREIAFGSDIDVLYVVQGEGAVERGTKLVRGIVDALSDPVLPFELDAGLRPEGRNGPLVRSLESYRAYYERWSEPWEAQALLRARPFAGDRDLAEALIGEIDARRFPAEFPAASTREIRRIKARVEAERLPRDADRSRHLKLGDGSLSDVEWLVQLLQLQHAASEPSLRTTSTVEALAAAARADLLPERDAAVLREAWTLASRIRNALALVKARTTDVLPLDRAELEAVARLIGMESGSARALEERYLAATRRARRVFERHFYGG